MTMGAKFRETPPCNKRQLICLYRDAIEKVTKSYMLHAHNVTHNVTRSKK